MAQRRGDRRRALLLDAALRLIGSGGVKAVSHRAVAAEAGVPLGSTTYYFASKDEIVVEALRSAARGERERIARQVAELEAEATPTDWADLLVDWLGRELRGPARVRLIALYSLQLETVHRPELRPIYEAWTLATLRLAQRVLEAAGAADPHRDAPLLLAALDGLRHNQLATRDAGVSRLAARAVVDPLARFVFAGRDGAKAPEAG